jgi:hypothetical protein
MEATCSSEPSVDFQRATWHYIPEDNILHVYYYHTIVILVMEERYLNDIKINHEVCQGCSLPLTIISIYLKDVIQEWKTRSNPVMWLQELVALNTLMFVEEKIIIQESEDELQKPVFHLNETSKSYRVQISRDSISSLYIICDGKRNSRTDQSPQICRI